MEAASPNGGGVGMSGNRGRNNSGNGGSIAGTDRTTRRFRPKLALKTLVLVCTLGILLTFVQLASVHTSGTTYELLMSDELLVPKMAATMAVKKDDNSSILVGGTSQGTQELVDGASGESRRRRSPDGKGDSSASMASANSAIAVAQSLPEQQASPEKKRKSREVHFIPAKQLGEHDPFSASWWQSTQRFVKIDSDRINIVEDAVFRAIEARKEVRMTSDWLDFSVEHMSKWWKVLRTLEQGEDDTPYKTAIMAFGQYIDRVLERHNVIASSGSSGGNDWEEDGTTKGGGDGGDKEKERSTIAIIAFAPYTSKSAPKEWGDTLTMLSLGATLASLLDGGFVGRVVVVGYRPEDEELVRSTFSLLSTRDTAFLLRKDRHQIALVSQHKRRRRRLQGRQGTTPPSPVVVNKIGPMEVTYIRVVDDDVKSKFIEVNMPRAAVVGLKRALLGEANKTVAAQWLGEGEGEGGVGHVLPTSRWRYVYLTEPDTILQTRPGAIPQLRRVIDEGNIVAPHRLQPIPHMSDLGGLVDTSLAVPLVGPFANVMELDAWDDGMCCDGGSQHPGNHPNTPNCGDFWWSCDFGRRSTGNATEDHYRLAKYDFMRLARGTGIVSLAGTEHGRMCQLRKGGGDDDEVCHPVQE